MKPMTRFCVSSSWKYNHYELKGVPLRMEVGPRDIAAGVVTLVRRDNGEKSTAKNEGLAETVAELLETIQKDMFARAKKQLDGGIKKVREWKSFCDNLEDKKLLLAPFCGAIDCEETIKKESKR